VMVASIVEDGLGTIESLARGKSIRIETEIEPNLRLVADGAKVRQMLLNLVSNAIKFTPNGGRVLVKARRDGEWVEISVADNGVGIAKSDLKRLFIEFQQIDSGLDRHPEGTGLGLALTRRFSELHGGRVDVESEQGKGSTFTLRLPADRRAAAAANPATAPKGPPLVLVVDDNPEAAEILARHLHSGGFRMEVARTGPEAIRMARELHPVAITLDILLPEIDGWEVLTRLKADPSTHNIPVVVVSVVDKPGLGRALGAVDYFVKPVDGKALLSRLEQYAFTAKVQTEEVSVLVVDDERANLDLLEGLLAPAGFKVIRAGGGQEGIDIAKSMTPNLILLDLMMPGVTGFEVVEALREEEATKQIPIMVLTAKILTSEDKRLLSGHVAAVFQRNSVAGPELVAWLRGIVASRTGAVAAPTLQPN